MLARWFDRSGIGQVLAPDAEATPVSENDESRSAVWQFLAPDDKFAPSKAPPPEVFPPAIRSVKSVSSPENLPQTPRTPGPGSENDDDDDLNSRVLSACRDTSKYMMSPLLERKSHEMFLRFCGSTKALNPKLLKKMRSMVANNSFKNAYLLRVRATRMGQSAPDGYTSLMVAAYAGHVEAAELILELAEDYAFRTGDKKTYSDLHLDRDMFGMTALHIAGERGHVEMIQFLLPLYTFPSPNASGSPDPSSKTQLSKNTTTSTTNNNNRVPSLVDLMGQTAFGRAVTSPVPKAKKNQRALEKNLFSSFDLSIFGKAKPIGERMGSLRNLKLDYGFSDMPGIRGYMEDFLSVETWVQENSGEMALFCVCDGHGDNGKVSEFVASNAKDFLLESIEELKSQNRDTTMLSQEYWEGVWNSTCSKLDQKLKVTVVSDGGSTGVFALVTEQEIIVANVGDSRCILAQESVRTESATPKEAAPAGEGDADAENENENDGDKNQSGTDDAETTTQEETAAPATTTENESEAVSDSPSELVQEDSKGAAPETTKPQDESGTLVVTALSEDHKPNLPDEKVRIETAGFTVKSIDITEEDGSLTVVHKVVKTDKDQLAVSRAFGDFDYKANQTLSENEQAVVALPGVTVYKRDLERDLYLVLACDGIWDVMENDEVIDLVRTQTKAKANTSAGTLLPDVADVLLQECLGRDSRDNMSAILVSLQPNQNNDESASAMPPKTLDFGSPKQ